MNPYEEEVKKELQLWEKTVLKRPTIWNKSAKTVQNKINEKIPQTVHDVITSSVKHMVKATLAGSEYTTKKDALRGKTLWERDHKLDDRLAFYRKTAALEGAGTGAGGIFLGLADFPLLLGIKMKFLFEAASIYGFNSSDYRERIYILYVFQLAFSSPMKKQENYEKVLNWHKKEALYPPDESYLEKIDWQSFQQDYRDHIDLIKLLQMVPGIGALVGAYANYNFLDELGRTAKNCYRRRKLSET
ncbi:EcsC family protein [Fictibacillus iocasae]|uniref:EcsC family protein n=1 Tax=Fictibacillus iocasae TaxID=2715437 RepID=A0ABW2NU14_9BACL